jgi:predicted type IV restriction endonuclease
MIAQTFDEAFAQLVKNLADRFQKDEKEYLKPTYQEAEVRQHFLDKFFVALGWDVYHQEQTNPYEREVKIEKSVMVGGRGKRADYAFYTAPNFAQARFMAEAKKPARQLENAQDCFQAIRYGWNSNTPISVLTDFEQFFILDSRYKPTIESSINRIIKRFHYTEFSDEEKFREIYFLFSRESVGNNSLENYAASLKKARGARQAKLFQTAQVQPVGDTFLIELDEHRETLARAFKRKNATLDGDELTEITQRALDRLVFIRFLEDKLVEPSEIIDNLGTKSGSAWRDSLRKCRA